VITDCGETFWTANAGATATSVLLPDPTNGMKDAAIGPDGFGYTLGETNQIFKTTDFGHSWTVGVTASDVANFHGISLIPGTHNAFIVGDNLTASTNYAGGDGGVAVDLISAEGTTITALPPPFKSLYVEGLQGVAALSACDLWSVGQETHTDFNPTSSDSAIVAHSTDCGKNWNRVLMPGDVGQQTSLNAVTFATVTPPPVVTTTTTIRHLHKTSILCVKGKVHKRITAIHPRCPHGFKRK